MLVGWTVKKESGQIIHGCSDLPSITPGLTIRLQGLGGLPGEHIPGDRLRIASFTHAVGMFKQ